jgi:hypothetical protein
MQLSHPGTSKKLFHIGYMVVLFAAYSAATEHGKRIEQSPFQQTRQ